MDEYAFCWLTFVFCVLSWTKLVCCSSQASLSLVFFWSASVFLCPSGLWKPRQQETAPGEDWSHPTFQSHTDLEWGYPHPTALGRFLHLHHKRFLYQPTKTQSISHTIYDPWNLWSWYNFSDLMSWPEVSIPIPTRASSEEATYTRASSFWIRSVWRGLHIYIYICKDSSCTARKQ